MDVVILVYISFRIMEDLCKEDSIDSNPDGDAGNTQIKLPEGQKNKSWQLQ